MSLSHVMSVLCLFAGLVFILNAGLALPVSFHGGNLTCAFAEVQFHNSTCDPPVVYIYKNATVVWMNRGPEEHAICIGDDLSPPLLAGESYTKNFHEFGEYEYYCRYPPGERGKVIVR
jgi:plastocyanin